MRRIDSSKPSNLLRRAPGTRSSVLSGIRYRARLIRAQYAFSFGNVSVEKVVSVWRTLKKSALILRKGEKHQRIRISAWSTCAKQLSDFERTLHLEIRFFCRRFLWWFAFFWWFAFIFCRSHGKFQWHEKFSPPTGWYLQMYYRSEIVRDCFQLWSQPKLSLYNSYINCRLCSNFSLLYAYLSYVFCFVFQNNPFFSRRRKRKKKQSLG